MQATLIVRDDNGEEVTRADFALSKGDHPVNIELTGEGVKIHSHDEPRLTVTPE